jgi:hypothetical protein
MEDPDDTAVVVRKEILNAPNWPTRIMVFVAGVSIAVGPVAAGWYSLKQAKIEAGISRDASKKETSLGYETLAGPLEKFRAAIAILDWRIQRLEDAQGARASVGPITPEPLTEPALKTPVPQTLIEADAVVQSKK